jgi:hypothetical protein
MIALWLAIHGGDPVPELIEIDETATVLATTLSAHLAATHGRPALTGDDEIELRTKINQHSDTCQCFGRPGIEVRVEVLVDGVATTLNACLCPSPVREY